MKIQLNMLSNRTEKIMYRMFEYRCPDNHIFSSLEEPDTQVIPCKVCGLESIRIISATRISMKDGVDPNSSQGNKWARAHREEAKRQNSKIDPNPSS